MSSIRVAIVGVGNCAASLVQGVHFYADADPQSTVPGLMHVQFGPYHVRDIEFVAAFDVDAKKVGFDLSEAIGASENNTIKIADVPPLGVTVQRGHTLDGLGKYYRETIEESDATPVDIVQTLKDRKVDVLISYLPVGSEDADKFYAQCAIDAKVAFVNALPVFIASDPVWAKKFEDAGVPIVGDDIKSQVGATITHRVLARLFEDRGVILDRTYQLNVGGNMDFKNMLERDRLESKKISKTQSVTSNMDHELSAPQRAHRPVGLRPVARRPQVGVRPPRGPRVRRGPAEPGVQARGLGLPELGRHHHRRPARREDRQGPRHRWPDPVRRDVLHEVAAGADGGHRRAGRSSRRSSAARSSAELGARSTRSTQAKGPGTGRCRGPSRPARLAPGPRDAPSFAPIPRAAARPASIPRTAARGAPRTAWRHRSLPPRGTQRSAMRDACLAPARSRRRRARAESSTRRRRPRCAGWPHHGAASAAPTARRVAPRRSRRRRRASASTPQAGRGHLRRQLSSARRRRPRSWVAARQVASRGAGSACTRRPRHALRDRSRGARRAWAALLYAGPGRALSHESAAFLHGLPPRSRRARSR